MFVYALFQKQRTSNKYSFIPYSGNSQEVTDKESLVRCPFNIHPCLLFRLAAASSPHDGILSVQRAVAISRSIQFILYLTILLSQLLTY